MPMPSSSDCINGSGTDPIPLGTAVTEFVATFNCAGSSNNTGVRMKVRQAYEGRVIEARSSELKNGGWDCEFSIEVHETTGVTETAFYMPGVFPTPEAAILAAVTAGKQKIDSGFENRPVVEY
jgi:hypothetical protein